jgi:hypothetical protein
MVGNTRRCVEMHGRTTAFDDEVGTNREQEHDGHTQEPRSHGGIAFTDRIRHATKDVCVVYASCEEQVFRSIVAIGLLAAAGCSGTQRVRAAGLYRFECDPSDARVIVDEDDRGPCSVWSTRWLGLTAGPHRLRIAREGWLPQESDITPQGRVTVRAHLRRVPD